MNKQRLKRCVTYDIHSIMGKTTAKYIKREKDITMTSAELKEYLEKVIEDLPEDTEKIRVDVLLFFQWQNDNY